MWNRRTTTPVMLLAVCLLGVAPTVAVAQIRATTGQGFMPLARVGQSVKVIDHQGQVVTGRVERVTASGLDLVLSRNQRRTVPAADAVRVVRLDSNVNGMLLGLAGGLGAGAAIGSSGCGGDPSCSAAQLAVGLPVGAGAGLLLGYLVEASQTRTLFLRDDRYSVVVVPVLGRVPADNAAALERTWWSGHAEPARAHCGPRGGQGSST